MKVNVYELTVKICKILKKQPIYLGLFLLYILTIIIYFPKYLYHLIRKQKIIAFDWGDGTYSDFYLPLFEKLDKSGLEILFFFRFGYANQYRMTTFKKGLPKVYGNFLDNKIVISATCSKYRKLSKTVRIQIFHGFGSFGSVWQRDFIDDFDILFLTTRCQWNELQTEEYKKIVEGKEVFRIGYPKIDKYVYKKDENDVRYNKKNITLFYGPTYHCEISSIFEFLPSIVEMCKRNRYKLIIKLHPFLYHKHSYYRSGGIDWSQKIYDYKENWYNDIIFLRRDRDNHNLGEYFRMTDVFLTDVSGIGFEFVLATSKPIIFLGQKLKVPLEDLRSGTVEKYKDYAEIYYRGRIGPIVKKPYQLEEVLKRTIEGNDYRIEIEKFRREFTFNLGVSADVAVSKIKKIYEEL